MRVFNACLLIIRRHIGAYALYFFIFLAISVVVTLYSVDQYSTDFAAMRPLFTVINRDTDGPLVGGLVTYLGIHGEEVILEDDKETLQDATFFHATDTIALVPAGFQDAFWQGQPATLETVAPPDTAKSYYVESLINQYLNQVRLYRATDTPGREGAVAAALSDLSTGAAVEKRHFGTGTPLGESYLVYARMMCYILLALIILCVSNMTSAFRRPDLRHRNLCAPLRPRTMSGQQVLCGALVGTLAWLLMTVLGFVLYGSELAGADGRMVALVLLNTFVVMLVSLALASLASMFIRNANTQNAVTNFLSLALCFLGGVFVPLEILGEGLLAVSRFTPGYWYVTALDNIAALTAYDPASLAPVWQAIALQLAFAAAFFSVTLAVSKHQNQSERGFADNRTELDA